MNRPTQNSSKIGESVNDRFRILQSLGEDALSTYELAEDLGHDCRIVLRRLKAELWTDTAGSRAFVQQLKGRFDNLDSAVTRPSALGRSGGSPWIATRVSEPFTFRHARDTGVECQQLLSQHLTRFAEQLDELHQGGQCHGDIRPETVLVDERGSISLMEFSSFHLLCGWAGDRRPYPAPIRKLLSVRYLAPEIGKGSSPGPKSDQYALAMTILDCLTASEPDELDGVQHSKPLPNKTQAVEALAQASGLAVHARQALRRALSGNPAERFPTCSEFAKEFSGRKQPSQNLSLPARIALAVGACALLVAMFFFGRQAKSQWNDAELARAYREAQQKVDSVFNRQYPSFEDQTVANLAVPLKEIADFFGPRPVDKPAAPPKFKLSKLEFQPLPADSSGGRVLTLHSDTDQSVSFGKSESKLVGVIEVELPDAQSVSGPVHVQLSARLGSKWASDSEAIVAQSSPRMPVPFELPAPTGGWDVAPNLVIAAHIGNTQTRDKWWKSGAYHIEEVPPPQQDAVFYVDLPAAPEASAKPADDIAFSPLPVDVKSPTAQIELLELNAAHFRMEQENEQPASFIVHLTVAADKDSPAINQPFARLKLVDSQLQFAWVPLREVFKKDSDARKYPEILRDSVLRLSWTDAANQQHRCLVALRTVSKQPAIPMGPNILKLEGRKPQTVSALPPFSQVSELFLEKASIVLNDGAIYASTAAPADATAHATEHRLTSPGNDWAFEGNETMTIELARGRSATTVNVAMQVNVGNSMVLPQLINAVNSAYRNGANAERALARAENQLPDAQSALRAAESAADDNPVARARVQPARNRVSEIISAGNTAQKQIANAKATISQYGAAAERLGPEYEKLQNATIKCSVYRVVDGVKIDVATFGSDNGER